MSIHRKISASRLKGSKVTPYFSDVIFSLYPVKTEADIIIAVDRWHRLYYNPDNIEEYSVNEITTMIIHEANHLLRGHHDRCSSQGLNHEVYNIAADFEINDDLLSVRPHLVIPEGTLFPEDFGLDSGKLAEYYYYKLVNDGNLPSITNNPMLGGSGSCATGDQQEYELGEPGESNPGTNKSESQLLQNITAEKIRQHAKQAGSIPGNLEKWAESHLKPQVNWKNELRKHIRYSMFFSAGSHDYTYSKPGRRQSPGIIFPSMHKPDANVAVVIDTSASMSDKETKVAVAELESILKNAGSIGVKFFSVDTDVAFSKQIHRKSEIKLKGGGGTDMGVGIQEAAKSRPKPDLCIVITDGYTPWPKHDYGMQIICVMTTAKSGPAYAKTIRVVI